MSTRASNGVALLAGVGAGIWSSVPEACRATIRVVDQRDPDPDNKSAYDGYFGLYRRLYHQLAGCFDEVQTLID